MSCGAPDIKKHGHKYTSEHQYKLQKSGIYLNVFYFLVDTVQDKVKKTWELLSVHQSVIVIIYNTDWKKLVLVKQFRPGG